MLRSPLLVIAYVLAVDIIGLVQKMVGGIQKKTVHAAGAPFPFCQLSQFSPSPSPPNLAPTMQATVHRFDLFCYFNGCKSFLGIIFDLVLV